MIPKFSGKACYNPVGLQELPELTSSQHSVQQVHSTWGMLAEQSAVSVSMTAVSPDVQKMGSRLPVKSLPFNSIDSSVQQRISMSYHKAGLEPPSAVCNLELTKVCEIPK